MRSRCLRGLGAPDPPGLRQTGRPTRRQPTRPRRTAATLRRRREKKVTQASRPLRQPQTRPLTLRLLGGLVLFLTTLYCGPAARTGQGRGREGTGLYPELAALGIIEGSSPALVSLVGRQCALLSSYQMARRELAARGTPLGIKVVHRIARQLGAAVLTSRTRDLLRWRAGLLPPGTELVGRRVAAMVDGGRTRIRTVIRKQKGKGKGKKQRRRYKAEWREPKLLIIFEIDNQGRLKKKTRPWIDGTFAGPDEAMDWVERRVGLAAGRAVRVLDWCHAGHNLSLALEALGLPEEERQRQYKELRYCLREGWWVLVVATLERLGTAAGSPKGLEQPLGYLTKHGEAGHLDYKRLRRRGLPQGSGAIESAIRRVINLRLKGPGLMWHEDNAAGALALRAAAVSERWEETMTWVREEMGRDRQMGWQWVAPDMPADLKADVPIKPPLIQKAVA